MPEPLKNIYHPEFIEEFSTSMKEIVPSFSGEAFLEDVFQDKWDSKELKERMRHIAVVLNKHLSGEFSKDVEAILLLIAHLQKKGVKEQSIEYMFLPDFIELYGLNDFNLSVDAFEEITKFTSCEFAVRPFILKYPEKMIKQMLKWSNHEHPSVRRLASEGARPRLPWAMAIPALKQDPSEIIPILENLKHDDSETVRRSVANNLNDISKDHASLVLELVGSWQGVTKETDALIKHASRTLLKQGNIKAMRLFGFGDIAHIEIANFRVLTPVVKVGESLLFAFNLKNTNLSNSNIRLEYGLYYQKANGSLSRKVFKISEKNYHYNQSVEIERKQSFKVITTRKYYSGKHQVSIIINGVELKKLDFELIK